MKTGTSLLLVLAAVAITPACEVKSPIEGVNITLQINNAPVQIDGPVMALLPGQVTEVNKSFSFGQGVGSVESVESVALEPSFFQFTPAAAGPGGVAAGSVSGRFIIAVYRGNSRFPFLAATVTVTNDVITGITPALASLESVVAHVRAHADAAAQNPATAARYAGWRDATPEAVLAEISELLAASDSIIRITVEPLDASLRGTVRLRQFSISGRVRQGD